MYAKIHAALNEHLQQFVDSDITIAWPNTKLVSRADLSYIRPTAIFALVDNIDFDFFSKQSGIYQVDIFVPKDKGLKDLYDLTQPIVYGFRTTTTVTHDNVEVQIARASFLGIEYLDSHIMGTIQIDFHCFLTRSIQ